MPKVYQKKANKDYPNEGIKKGDTYYLWSFRYGGTRKSLTRPKPSQLTQSEYLSTIYELQERDISGETMEELSTLRDDIVSELEELRDAQQEKLDNMPEGLQQGSTGELLQERYDTVDGVVSELEGIYFDEPEPGESEDLETLLQEKADEISSALGDLY
jgi:hypothetical protein